MSISGCIGDAMWVSRREHPNQVVGLVTAEDIARLSRLPMLAEQTGPRSPAISFAPGHDVPDLVAAQNQRAQERTFLGGHVSVEVLDELVQVRGDRVPRAVEAPPECGVLGGMLLEHPFGQQRSPGITTFRMLEEEREKQAGFGPIVLVEVHSQACKGIVKFNIHRFATPEALRQRAALRDVLPNPFVLRE